MEDFFKSDQFGLFILKEYFTDKEMSNLEKLEQVFSSMENYTLAMDCFKLSRSRISKYQSGSTN